MYCLGDLKIAHVCAALFFHVALTDFFPDPDCTVAATGGYDQSRVIHFMSRWLRTALAGKKIDFQHAFDASTRRELIDMIQPGKDDERHSAPKGLCYLNQYAPSWPSMINGGPRYLQWVRDRFNNYYNILMAAQQSLGCPKAIFTISPTETLGTAYGLTVTDPRNPLGVPAWWNLPTNTGHGLIIHPKFGAKAVSIPAETIRPRDFRAIAAELEISPEQAAAMWARTHLEGIVTVFSRLNQQADAEDRTRFFTDMKRYYALLRGTIARSAYSNEHLAPISSVVERHTKERLTNIIADEERVLLELARETAIRTLKVAKANQALDRGIYVGNDLAYKNLPQHDTKDRIDPTAPLLGKRKAGAGSASQGKRARTSLSSSTANTSSEAPPDRPRPRIQSDAQPASTEPVPGPSRPRKRTPSPRQRPPRSRSRRGRYLRSPSPTVRLPARSTPHPRSRQSSNSPQPRVRRSPRLPRPSRRASPESRSPRGFSPRLSGIRSITRTIRTSTPALPSVSEASSPPRRVVESSPQRSPTASPGTEMEVSIEESLSPPPAEVRTIRYRSPEHVEPESSVDLVLHPSGNDQDL